MQTFPHWDFRGPNSLKWTPWSLQKDPLKCILTMYFPDTELLLAYLMNRCTPGAVRRVFELLQKSLGGAYVFISVFPIILTDRGGEFGSPERLETAPDGIQRTSIYYYGPMRGNQKGGD